MHTSRMTKICKKCGLELPIGNFSLKKRSKNKLRDRCDECHHSSVQWAYRNPEKVRESVLKHRASGKERNTRLQALYRITAEQYDDILKSQKNGCAICGGLKSKGKYAPLAVDHDHETGIVRGLLCNACNRGLGFFCDSKDLLQKAINYLKQ